MKNDDICNQMIKELEKQYSAFTSDDIAGNTDKIIKIAKSYFEHATLISSDKKEKKSKFFVLVVNNHKKINDIELKQKIKNELEKLNYNLSYKGTKFLEDSIYLIYTSDMEKDNLTKEIYPIIAKKYNTSIENVKCDIIQASNNSYYECPQKVMENYFGYQLISKPKTKDIIYAVIRKLNY